VDDGAELRKLSLACMDTLFDKCADKLDTSTFLVHLQERLSDELDDMKQAAYQLLCKLAVREPFFVREVSPLPMRPVPVKWHACVVLFTTPPACAIPGVARFSGDACACSGVGLAGGPHLSYFEEEDQGERVAARRGAPQRIAALGHGHGMTA
jgi:hypothetical protein